MDVSIRTRQQWAAEAIENGGAPTRPEMRRRLSLIMDDSVMGLQAAIAAAATAWPDYIRLRQVQVLAQPHVHGHVHGRDRMHSRTGMHSIVPVPMPVPVRHWFSMGVHALRSACTSLGIQWRTGAVVTAHFRTCTYCI